MSRHLLRPALKHRMHHPPRPLTAAAPPFDGITFAALYGMKRFLTSYTGNLVRIRRSSDDAELDIGYMAATGLLDTAAAAAHIGGGSGFVVTWYDQSGNGRNATQATAAAQPVYTASAVNSLPAPKGKRAATTAKMTFTMPSFAGSAGSLVVLYALDGTQTMYGLAKMGSAADGYWRYNGDGKGYFDAFRAVRLEGYPASMPSTGVHIASVVSGASYIGYIDGASQGSQSANFGVPASGVLFFNNASVDGGVDGWIPFFALTESALSTANHNTIGNELATLYGLSWTTVS